MSMISNYDMLELLHQWHIYEPMKSYIRLYILYHMFMIGCVGSWNYNIIIQQYDIIYMTLYPISYVYIIIRQLI